MINNLEKSESIVWASSARAVCAIKVNSAISAARTYRRGSSSLTILQQALSLKPTKLIEEKLNQSFNDFFFFFFF